MLKYFELLKNVLSDAFDIPVYYFTPPYEGIEKIDGGLRSFVWSDYNDADTKVQLEEVPQKYRLLIIKSNLGFYNILAFFGNDNKSDFISIGPFRDNELTADYFVQIMKEGKVSPKTLQTIKHTYEKMPLAQVDTVVNITRHILSVITPEFKDLPAELIEYSDHKRPVEINTELIEKNFLDFALRYHRLLSEFLKFIREGANPEAKETLRALLHESKLSANKNLKTTKALLQALNDYCHLALMDTDIHPSHILKQAFSLSNRIDAVNTIALAEQMPYEICRKYCLLVKNYSRPEHSKLTKDIVAYIQLHLDEELSLKTLAAHFNKNASALSGAFSKEMGMTLTNFIQQTRINEAIRLFNTTHMSVSEVSTAVGYQDFSYFSKIFKKITGLSPKDYRID